MSKSNPRLIPGRAAAVIFERKGGGGVELRVLTGSDERATTAALMVQSTLLDGVDFVAAEKKGVQA